MKWIYTQTLYFLKNRLMDHVRQVSDTAVHIPQETSSYHSYDTSATGFSGPMHISYSLL